NLLTTFRILAINFQKNDCLMPEFVKYCPRGKACVCIHPSVVLWSAPWSALRASFAGVCPRFCYKKNGRIDVSSRKESNQPRNQL
ncbi:hypothetical protein PMAYCL1PPCAC_00888, partial [Pristionchus mayeri]